MRRLWARVRDANPLAVDSVFAALALVAGLVSLTAEPTPANPTPTDALAVVLVVVGFGALALRRRYPIAVLLVATVAAVVYVARDYPDNGLPVVALIALYTVASLRDRRVWVTAVTVFLVALGISAITHPNQLNLVDLVGTFAIFGIAAVFGDSVRLRRAYTAALEARAAALERNQQTEAKRAVAEERLRIARELHDVVAHAMSVVAVQSGVGAHVIDDDPAEAKRILLNVKVTSRQALDEMRLLLGVLRQQEPDDNERARPRSGPRSRPRRGGGAGPGNAGGGRAGAGEGLRHPGRRPARRRPVRLPDRPGGAHQRVEARRSGPGRGRRRLPAGGGGGDDHRRRPGGGSGRNHRGGWQRPARDAGAGGPVRGRPHHRAPRRRRLPGGGHPALRHPALGAGAVHATASADAT